MSREDLTSPLPKPNLESERRAPFYLRANGEVMMIDRLLNAVNFEIDPKLKPFLVNIAKRLELLANDLKHDLKDLTSTQAKPKVIQAEDTDSVKPVSTD